MRIARWRGSKLATQFWRRVRRGEVRSGRSLPSLGACLVGAMILAPWMPDARADDYPVHNHSVVVAGDYSLSVRSELTDEFAEFNPDLPLFDVGRIVLTVNAVFVVASFSCNPVLTQNGSAIVMTAVVQAGTFPGSGFCDGSTQGYLGPLAPGQYQVTAHVVRYDGVALADLSLSITVVARGAKCNVNPFAYLILATPQNKTLEQFVTAFQTDPVYRSQFGDVTLMGIDGNFLVFNFPVLSDPARILDRLLQTGEFDLLDVPQLGAEVCFPESPPDAVYPVVEYYNNILDHYFMTPDANEQAAIDAGKVGPGWSRTGETFGVVIRPYCPEAVEGRRHPVYRFAGIPNAGPNSHFFTVSQDECAVVRDKVEWHWYLEGAPFWATEPSQGTCPPGTKVLLRAYNNGKGGSANHRYSTKQTIIDAMVAQGWVSEGTVMCVVP